MEIINTIDEYNHLSNRFHLATSLQFDWAERTEPSAQSLNLTITYQSSWNDGSHLTVKFFGIRQLSYVTPFAIESFISFLHVGSIKDQQLEDLSYSAIETDDHEPYLRFSFKQFYAIIEEYHIP